VGTIEYLSRFAILGAPVLLLIECKFFDDCTFRYDALEMRGDGSTDHGRYSHFYAACLFCMENQ
jgi:hypothetical protein